MPLRLRTALGFLSLLALVSPILLGLGVASAPSVAIADTPATTGTATATTGQSITPALNPNPVRTYGGGADAGTPAPVRPSNLTPLGVSYSDCVNDLNLQFNVNVSGFGGSESLQVWAGKSTDCTAAADRGQGQLPVCWLVNQGSAGLLASTVRTITYNVRAQDLVAQQNVVTSGTSYVKQGVSACSAQPSFLAVPINVNFVSIPAGGGTGTTVYTYTVNTDLVGPQAPTGVSIADGDTLFVVNWPANADSDTAAYDVVIDPIPGQESTSSAPANDASYVTTLVCPDTGAAAATEADAGDGAITDADASDADANDANDANATDAAATDAAANDANATDAAATDAAATDAAATDAAATDADTSDADTSDAADTGDGSDGAAASAKSSCHTMVTPVQPATGGAGLSCEESSSVLAGGTVLDAGATMVDVTNDAGMMVDASVSSGSGGVWTPPAGHVVAANQTTGTTISGLNSSTYTISGLKNGQNYHVVVAAVDAYGNIGPPSNQACDFPAPVTDFWDTYRGAGGQAGGGFCALEAVGGPGGSMMAFGAAGAMAMAVLRRLRRKR